jgi:hypothetical protein
LKTARTGAASPAPRVSSLGEKVQGAAKAPPLQLPARSTRALAVPALCTVNPADCAGSPARSVTEFASEVAVKVKVGGGGGGDPTVTVTVAAASWTVPFFAARVIVPLPGALPPVNVTVTVIASSGFGSEPVPGDAMQPLTLPLHSRTTNFGFTDWVPVFVTVKVVLLLALVATVAVP